MTKRRTLWLLVAVLSILVGGCALPGGKTPVGWYRVEGRMVDSDGHALAGQEIRYLDPQHTAWPTPEMVIAIRTGRTVTTDADGRFACETKGFTHCHPTWIIPPLLTLAAAITGQTRHGKWFLVKTPGDPGQVYEVHVRSKDVKLRVYDPLSRKFSLLKKAGAESVSASVRPVNHEWLVEGKTYTRKNQCVILDIKL